MNIKTKLTLADVHAQFEHWRKTRQHRSPIPKELWDSATNLVGEYSTLEIAKTLNLGHSKLKKRIAASSSESAPTPSADFVELGVMEPTVKESSCVIEISDKNGATVKMTMNGTPCFDIVKLAQAFWAKES